MLGLTCIFENKAKSVLHSFNQMPSYQFSYEFRYEIDFSYDSKYKIISGINISLGASLVTELDDPGEKDFMFLECQL